MLVWLEVLENKRYPKFPLQIFPSGKNDSATPALCVGEYSFVEKYGISSADKPSVLWLVLEKNPDFGLPCSVLKGYEVAGRIVVAHDNGDAYFEN